ncbi:hypothetical protein JTE90_028152 [Oedothorax gibbosus]|uniref:Secreted protein n=1 Tax=Oedothorax gibbosus TaxID=931172 RepID=A0AAV6V8U3_9ARAC|nr:hypothetical protein JTE90_028152 [Oedothorax gibbosus]
MYRLHVPRWIYLADLQSISAYMGIQHQCRQYRNQRTTQTSHMMNRNKFPVYHFVKHWNAQPTANHHKSFTTKKHH